MTLRNGSSASLCRLLEVVVGLIFVSGCGGSGGGGGSTLQLLEPNVSLSPSSLALGNQAVGSTSAPQTVTLSNTGNAALSLSSIAITGANAGDFAQTNTCGNSVGAGGSCTISVMFTPTASGSRAASVTIADNAAGSPQTVGLSGVGVAPVISISPMSLAFGNQPVGTKSAAQTVTVSNTGSTSLSLASITITGANPGDFAQSDNCGSAVAAGGNCTINVTFTPTMDGPRNAAIIVTTDVTGSPQTVALTGTGTGQFMTLSPNKTHLVNTITNTPVFITGDAPQVLFTQLDNADVEPYLADRASRGFNALWVLVIDNVDQANAPEDYYGNVPFDGPDFTNEDAAYWAHIDYVLGRIEAYGMTAFMSAAFVGTPQFVTSYYYNSLLDSSDATMTAYGQWLGNRYKNYPNIVWVLGGDAPATSAIYSKLADIGNGLQSADPNHLITLEACRECSQGSNLGQQSTLEAYTYLGESVPSFMGLNWAYAKDPNVISECRGAYASTSGGAIPPLMGEDTYELDSSVTSAQVRTEGYWEVLSGCYLGRLFGNDAIWTFNAPQFNNSSTPWQIQLDSTGSVGQETMGALFRSREHWLLVPDINRSVLTAGYGSGATISVAARTSDGQTIIAYVPNGNAATITINMTKITSAIDTAKCWWFNPSTGAATLIGTFATSGTQNYTPPDSNDWVLVIDDANANLPAPGSAGS